MTTRTAPAIVALHRLQGVGYLVAVLSLLIIVFHYTDDIPRQGALSGIATSAIAFCIIWAIETREVRRDRAWGADE